MQPDDLSILIICPRAHFKGHFWNSTKDIANALTKKGVLYHIVMLTAENMKTDPIYMPHTTCVFKKTPFWFRAINPATTKQQYKSLQSFEHFWDLALSSFVCSIRAFFMLKHRKYSGVYFSDGFSPISILFALLRHTVVLHQCCTSYFLPNSGLKQKILSLMQRWLTFQALKTNRIYFIFENKHTQENDSVNGLGKSAVHIPEAITVQDVLPEKKACRRCLNIKEDQVIFLFFGAHRLSKDYDTAFNAARQIFPSPCLLFAGPVVDNNPQIIAKKYNYNSVLFFNQFVPHEDVKYYFCASDVVVLPYVPGTNDIGGSSVFFLACQYNRPVITTYSPFFNDLFAHYDVGFQYHNANVKKLAQCMRNFLEMNSDKKKQIETGLDRIRRDFSWDNMIAKYLDILKVPLKTLEKPICNEQS
ncbi:MAG: glycosyltransferase [Kiritimatiellae bacterium]|nr:glycosyltransferase [Kiritimatiellia bacterium]